MNTETGEINTMEYFREHLTEQEIKRSVRPIGKWPEASCSRCAGTGVIRKTFGRFGFLSKKFKPCRCTNSAPTNPEKKA